MKMIATQDFLIRITRNQMSFAEKTAMLGCIEIVMSDQELIAKLQKTFGDRAVDAASKLVTDRGEEVTNDSVS